MDLLKNYYIYRGFVSHYRFYPKIHKFKYRIFSLLINLEKLKSLEKNTKFFSINKFNLFSFYFKDHTEKPFNNPFFWAKAILTNKNLYDEKDRIYILCYPRILGYVFNPLTTYFCIDKNNNIKAVKYEFNTKILNKSIKVEIKYYKKDKTNLLNAIFYGEQSELNDKNLLLCFFAYPLMTIKVIYSIHLHALYLWIKGIKFFNRPNPSKDIISFSKTLIKDNVKDDRNN